MRTSRRLRKPIVSLSVRRVYQMRFAMVDKQTGGVTDRQVLTKQVRISGSVWRAERRVAISLL